jgi:hypothetical protein
VLASSRSDQAGLSALASRRSSSLAANSRMKNPPMAHRGQEHGQPVAGEQLDQEGAAHRGDRHADAKDPGDQAALTGRDLVGEHRHQGGQQGVEEQLGDAPSDQTTATLGPAPP